MEGISGLKLGQMGGGMGDMGREVSLGVTS